MNSQGTIENNIRQELSSIRMSASAAAERTGIPYRSVLRTLSVEANPPLLYAVLLSGLLGMQVEEMFRLREPVESFDRIAAN